MSGGQTNEILGETSSVGSVGSEGSVGSVESVGSVGSVESVGSVSSVESVSRVKGVNRKTIGVMTSLAVRCVSPPRLGIQRGPETGHLPG